MLDHFDAFVARIGVHEKRQGIHSIFQRLFKGRRLGTCQSSDVVATSLHICTESSVFYDVKLMDFAGTSLSYPKA